MLSKKLFQHGLHQQVNIGGKINRFVVELCCGIVNGIFILFLLSLARPTDFENEISRGESISGNPSHKCVCVCVSVCLCVCVSVFLCVWSPVCFSVCVRAH